MLFSLSRFFRVQFFMFYVPRLIPIVKKYVDVNSDRYLFFIRCHFYVTLATSTVTRKQSW